MAEAQMINTSTYQEDSTYEYEGYTTLHPLKIEPFWEEIASKYMFAVPSIVLLIIGTVGNTLSFMVFNKKSMKQSVTSIYFRVLAVTDTVVLYSGCVVDFLDGAFSKDVRLYADGTCKFFEALLKVTCYDSCWLLVLISIDRFIGVYFPHKYRQLCTRRRAIMSMVIVLFAMLAFTGAFWLTVLGVNHNKCEMGKGYVHFFTSVYQYIDLCVLNLLPSVILVSTNITILHRISRSSFGSGGDSNSGSTSKVQSKSNSLTAILLTISLVYILCTIPTSTAFLVIRTFKGPSRAARIVFYLRTCKTLYYFNHAINFFLYCIHGTAFRKELKGLLCKTEGATSTASNSTNMSAYTVSQSAQNG